jgi:hypothetical protein
MGQKTSGGFKYKTNIVWIDQNVNSKENQSYLNSKVVKEFKNYEIFTFIKVDEGINFLKKLRYTCTYIILSGRLFLNFIESFKQVIKDIFIIPKILIFCGSKKKLYNNFPNEYLDHKFFNSGKVFDSINMILRYFEKEVQIEKQKNENDTNYFTLTNTFEFGSHDKIIPEVTNEEIDILNNDIFQNSNPNSKLEELFIQTVGVSEIPIQIIFKYYILAYNLESKILRNYNYHPILIKVFQTAIKDKCISNNISEDKIYCTILLHKKEIESIKENLSNNQKVIYPTKFLHFTSSKNQVSDRIKNSIMPQFYNSIIIELESKYYNNSMNLINLSSFQRNKNENYLFFPFTVFEISNLNETNLKDSYIIELKSPYEKQDNEIKEEKEEKKEKEEKEGEEGEKGEEEGVFPSNFLEAFCCPITQEIMQDPVMTKYGHTYERSEIEKWIDKHHNDPLTKKPLEKSDLIPNYAMKNLIEEYLKLKNNK